MIVKFSVKQSDGKFSFVNKARGCFFNIFFVKNEGFLNKLKTNEKSN